METNPDIAVDVVEVPTESVGTDDSYAPNNGRDKDFDSFFNEAVSKSAQTSPEADNETEEEAEPAVSDDQIPDEPAKPAAEIADAEEEDAETTENTDETEEPDEAKAEKKSRSTSYKEAITRAETAEAEAQKTTERIEKLDKQFEKFGGIEAVEDAVNLYETLMDKTKADEFIREMEQLPHYGTMAKKVIDRAMENPAQRVFSVNQVLTEDFGLSKQISQPLMEKAFEFMTNYINDDPQEFENFLDRELEFANTEEKEIARLKAENERLKNPPVAQNAAPQETEQETIIRLQTKHNEFFDGQFNEVALPDLKSFGYAVSSNDPPQMKADKEKIAKLIRNGVQVELAQKRATEPLIEQWMSGKDDENSSFVKAATRNYRNVLKHESEDILKTLARLQVAIGKTKPNPTSEAHDKVASAQNPKSNIAPTSQKRKPSSFDEAFELSKSQAGVR